jgi:hypothetical protein
VTDAKPIEGFNNEQLLKLKNKKSMHQAGGEENQWKFVYYILFPDTELFEFPSPCEFINSFDSFTLISHQTTITIAM